MHSLDWRIVDHSHGGELARRGMARRGLAWQGKARAPKVRSPVRRIVDRSHDGELGLAWPGEARPGEAGQGMGTNGASFNKGVSVVNLKFIDHDKSFAESSCKRFDLIRSFAGESWHAIDWDTGRSVRGTREHCEQWCAKQLQPVETSRD